VLDAQQHVGVGAELGGPASGHQTVDPAVSPPAGAGVAPVEAAAPTGTVPLKAMAAGTPAATLRLKASLPSGDPTGNQHENRCPAPAVRDGGSSSRHRSWT
jgi:hypothetical protein